MLDYKEPRDMRSDGEDNSIKYVRIVDDKENIVYDDINKTITFLEDLEMKTWNAAEIVELNIAETAHGTIDAYVEFSHNGHGFNNDLADGKDSDGDGNPKSENDTQESVTPDTLS